MNENENLLEAIKKGDLTGVKKTLFYGTDDLKKAFKASKKYHHDEIKNAIFKKITSTFIDAIQNYTYKKASSLKFGRIILKESSYYTDFVLEAAILSGDLKLAKLAIENGARVNNLINSPLILAATVGNYNIVKLLLEKGAERDKTAADKAKQFGHLKCYNLLKLSSSKKPSKKYARKRGSK